MSEKTVRRCQALVTKKNGYAYVATFKLTGNLPFALSEMRKWIMDANKAIKSVKFLSKDKT